MLDAGNLKSKIDKIIQENMAAVNQRTKYLVAQSRGLEAYRASFNESLLETQRSLHHVFCSLDSDFAEVEHEVKRYRNLNQKKNLFKNQAIAKSSASLLTERSDITEVATKMHKISNEDGEFRQMILDLKSLFEDNIKVARINQ